MYMWVEAKHIHVHLTTHVCANMSRACGVVSGKSVNPLLSMYFVGGAVLGDPPEA